MFALIRDYIRRSPMFASSRWSKITTPRHRQDYNWCYVPSKTKNTPWRLLRKTTFLQDYNSVSFLAKGGNLYVLLLNENRLKELCPQSTEPLYIASLLSCTVNSRIEMNHPGMNSDDIPKRDESFVPKLSYLK